MKVNNGQPWVRSHVARKALGVTSKTLAKWARAGYIDTIPLPGRGVRQHRLFNLQSVQPNNMDPAPCTTRPKPPPLDDGRFDAIYARVSTRKQSDDLERQVLALQTHHPHARVFRDVTSGINFRRPALRALLVHVMAGRVRCVHVTHQDRSGLGTFFPNWKFSGK